MKEREKVSLHTNKNINPINHELEFNPLFPLL